VLKQKVSSHCLDVDLSYTNYEYAGAYFDGRHYKCPSVCRSWGHGAYCTLAKPRAEEVILVDLIAYWLFENDSGPCSLFCQCIIHRSHDFSSLVPYSSSLTSWYKFVNL